MVVVVDVVCSLKVCVESFVIDCIFRMVYVRGVVIEVVVV